MPTALPLTLADYLLFIDESGDHVLEKLDPEYPVFVLAGVLIRKDEYARAVVPALVELKLKYFGSDATVLHEREIRKARPPFSMLRDPKVRFGFMTDISKLVASAPVLVVAAVIRKPELKSSYSWPESPYNLALSFILERVHLELTTPSSRNLSGGRTRVVVESRGAKEDTELELEFRRIRDGGNACHVPLDFEIEFVRKEGNVAGLQLADLMARPIGRHVLNPQQPNAAFDVVFPKLRRRPGASSPSGWGLKIFP